MKIAIIFWGLTRSLKYTIDSIRNNIFQILEKKSVEYDVFIHTLNINDGYHNPRAKEPKVKTLISDDCVKLNPVKYCIENQKEVQSSIGLNQYRKKGDPWNTNPRFKTLDNFITAMYSKMKSTQFSLDHGDYDYYMFVRPDVKYIKPIDVNWFSLANDTTILIPDFHIFYGMNDRAAICTKPVAKIYGLIFPHLLEYSKKYLLHSEQTLKRHMDLNKISIKRIPFRFNRVRINGSVLNDN